MTTVAFAGMTTVRGLRGSYGIQLRYRRPTQRR